MTSPGLHELIAGTDAAAPPTSIEGAELTRVMEEMWESCRRYAGPTPMCVIIPLERRVVVKRRGKRFTYFVISNWAKSLLAASRSAGLRCLLSP